jgi:hypothetical protein
MTQVGFKATIPSFERAKTLNALDRAAGRYDRLRNRSVKGGHVEMWYRTWGGVHLCYVERSVVFKWELTAYYLRLCVTYTAYYKEVCLTHQHAYFDNRPLQLYGSLTLKLNCVVTIGVNQSLLPNSWSGVQIRRYTDGWFLRSVWRLASCSAYSNLKHWMMSALNKTKQHDAGRVGSELLFIHRTISTWLVFCKQFTLYNARHW